MVRKWPPNPCRRKLSISSANRTLSPRCYRPFGVPRKLIILQEKLFPGRPLRPRRLRARIEVEPKAESYLKKNFGKFLHHPSRFGTVTNSGLEKLPLLRGEGSNSGRLF